MDMELKPYLISPDMTITLKDYSTNYEMGERNIRESELSTGLARKVREIQKKQKILFAENRQALLVILQGLDTSGKDSTIKHVCTGVNPQGVRVYAFGVPTSSEFEFSFLHRFWSKFPARGYIHVFNRSYYEEVTVVRVHPDLLERRHLRKVVVGPKFWQQRMEDINALESHLARNGTKILKIFLHISKEEQRKRLVARLNDPQKFWKFDPSDIQERQHWGDYQEAYSLAISATTTEMAPWYVIPADSKPIARVLVANLITATLSNMAPKMPELTDDQNRIAKRYEKMINTNTV